MKLKADLENSIKTVAKSKPVVVDTSTDEYDYSSED
jgi:hypothetical protein